ncbi:hypothetical protein BDW42DRAFT_190705 [Aspergillus taichungensis]|uniref:Uncharacterized protein n=1 Tax=Aspergillus taichungensis TaxID=482145 RepID=A0A2J5I6U1_9EURO|nr:hypothetical protein BDW42DRAFT_190705 [Aspergillus taichungensis]
MLVSRALFAACGLFATHAAAQVGVFEVGFQPINQESLGSESSYQIKWSVQEGDDFQNTYMTNFCYWKGPQVTIQGYTITGENADSNVTVTLYGETKQQGEPYSQTMEGPTNGTVKWGPNKVGTWCLEEH